MLLGYADFSQTLVLYCFFPYITAYVSYVTYGVCSVKGGDAPFVQSVAYAQRSSSLGFAIPVYFSFWLPVFLTFSILRGVEGITLTGTNALYACNLKWVQLLLSFYMLSLASLLLKQSAHGQNLYGLETFYAYIFLLLAWFFISFSSSILTFLLALEVITLLLLMLICSLGLFDNFGHSSFRGNGDSAGLSLRQAQYSLVSILLAFVWVMGFATIFFLWAVALAFPVLGSVDFFQVNLASLNWSHLQSEGVFSNYLISGGWLGFALLFKLVLQPFQTFLTIFYKQLPPVVLFGYFQFYYVFVLFFIFFFVVTPFGFISLS